MDIFFFMLFGVFAGVIGTSAFKSDGFGHLGNTVLALAVTGALGFGYRSYDFGIGFWPSVFLGFFNALFFIWLIGRKKT